MQYECLISNRTQCSRTGFRHTWFNGLNKRREYQESDLWESTGIVEARQNFEGDATAAAFHDVLQLVWIVHLMSIDLLDDISHLKQTCNAHHVSAHDTATHVKHHVSQQHMSCDIATHVTATNVPCHFNACPVSQQLMSRVAAINVTCHSN